MNIKQSGEYIAVMVPKNAHIAKIYIDHKNYIPGYYIWVRANGENGKKWISEQDFEIIGLISEIIEPYYKKGSINFPEWWESEAAKITISIFPEILPAEWNTTLIIKQIS